MSVPIFVDLQGFLVGRHFIIKEFAALKDGFELFYYIFGCSVPCSLTKAERAPGDWKSSWNIMGGMRWNGSILHG